MLREGKLCLGYSLTQVLLCCPRVITSFMWLKKGICLEWIGGKKNILLVWLVCLEINRKVVIGCLIHFQKAYGVRIQDRWPFLALISEQSRVKASLPPHF